MKSFLTLRCATLGVIVGFLFILPTNKAFALDFVQVVGDNSQTAIQSTISAVADTANASSLSFLALKENVLDGIAKQVMRQAVRQIVADTINWINSGFNGKPAFVTNLDSYLLNIADGVAGDFIYNNEDLQFLCSPFQLDIRIALEVQYNRTRGDTFQPQCTLSDVTDNIESFVNGSFTEGGGWESWFELTQSEYSDPNKALIAAESELYARITDAQGNTITELGWGDGFLSYKVCADTDVASGAQTDCQIVTPGQTIANELNDALGVGREELITADEVNEILGALLAQLSQKALQGIGGILGLSSGGGVDTTGDGIGDSSYLDALLEEDDLRGTSTPGTTTPPPGTSDGVRVVFSDHIAQQRDYIALLQQKVNIIVAAEARHEANAQSTSCSLPNFPSSLRTERIQTEELLQEERVRLAAMQEIQQRYRTAVIAQNVSAQQRIVTEFLGVVPGTEVLGVAMARLRIAIQYDITDAINAHNNSVDYAVARCRDNDR